MSLNTLIQTESNNDFDKIQSLNRYNTDIESGLDQIMIPITNSFENIFLEAINKKANIIVKPTGNNWYIKGIKKKVNFEELKIKIEENQSKKYRSNTKLWLLSYSEDLNLITKNELLKEDLKNSKIISCKILDKNNNTISEELNYTGNLRNLMKINSGRDIIKEFSNTRPGKYTEKGFRYIEEIQISYQLKDATNTMKDLMTLIDKFNYKIEIKIKLKNNKIIVYK